MGLVGLPVICQQLIAHGRSAETPAALVQQGTTSNQRVFTATLGTLAERIAQEDVQAPTLLIVGEVVQLREARLVRRGAGGGSIGLAAACAVFSGAGRR